MKGIVLFMSKAGSTKEYAKWISEGTGFPLHDLNENKRPDLDDADVIIIGSWILASKMVAGSWIRKNWNDMKGKKVILFSTSGAKPDFILKKEFLESSLPDDIRNNVDYLPLQGRFRKENLNLLYRSLLGLASRMFKEDRLVKDLKEGVDGVKKENLEDLFELVNDIKRG